MPVKKYIKKPIPIEALQITDNLTELVAFLAESGRSISLRVDTQEIEVTIYTLEGEMTAYLGDYIVKGIKGELYPCRKDIFEESYAELGVDS